MIFLTGATGNLAAELVPSLLSSGHRVALLVRDKQLRAEDRVKALFGRAFTWRAIDAGRLHIIPGDVTEPGLGASPQLISLQDKFHYVVHSAAQTSFTASLDEACSVNEYGTSRILQFSENLSRRTGRRIHFCHVSTAYVVGDRSGVFGPDFLSQSGPFRNSYEQSKANGEGLVRAAAGALDVLIIRPSIIVGHSGTGHIRSFNVLYVPARVVLKRQVTCLPAEPECPLDTVPVDFVAETIASAITRRDTGSYHVVSGVGCETTPNELVTVAQEACRDLKVPPPKVQFNVRGKLPRGMEPYGPYLVRNPQFIVSRKDLAAQAAPSFVTYGRNLFRYCIQSNWGKAAPSLRVPQGA